MNSPAATPHAPPLANAALLRNVFALAAPTTLVALLQVAAQLVETWLAARQGTAALAGWAVMLPFALLMQQMSTGAMGGGVVSAIARALGAARIDEASSLVMHALTIALAAGLAFTIGLCLFGATILESVAGAEAAQAAHGYVLLLFGLGAVPSWLANTFASVLRGGGRHALAARTLTLTWIAFPLLAWVLCEPAGMGLGGIGAAFSLVFIAAALSMAIVVLRGGAGFMPVFRQRLKADLFRRILSIGATACGLAAIANLTTILVTRQLREYGTAAVAAYGISARLEFLIIPLAFGVGSALTALVGKAAGGNDWPTARRLAWLGGAVTFAATALLGIGVALGSDRFTAFFTQDAQVAAIAAAALGFIGPAFGGLGLGMALYFASMGAGRMKWPVLAALSRIVLAVGGGWLLANVAGMGMSGHFLGVALGLAAYGLFGAAGVRKAVWSAR
ncbi:MATE family efflux transporter [Noviherbaspirillum aerium]|uniref:MATE family efflux transporter n=1 Tax=Noviherbaspirillum aerium TaxID=2588497 RepID=UPI00124C230F|nr:MATE family efflux transporter [Noviherbaspirillum aerium]